jgi:hypothetical protein
MPYACKEDKAKQMQRYRVRKSEEDAAKDAVLRNGHDLLKEEYLESLMADGKSREQAENYYEQYCTMPEERSLEETQPVAMASDSADSP